MNTLALFILGLAVVCGLPSFWTRNPRTFRISQILMMILIEASFICGGNFIIAALLILAIPEFLMETYSESCLLDIERKRLPCSE